MSAGIRLFQLELLPLFGTIEGWRNLSGPEAYRLCVDGRDDWLLTPKTAGRLGDGAVRIALRLKRARKRHEDAEPKMFFSGKDDAGTVLLEIGITEGNGVYLTIGDDTLRLTGADAETVLDAFARFAEDVSATRLVHVQQLLYRPHW
jgi:hypothetical protein